MVRIATEGEYVPWYSRRACPVFCYPCVPAYMGVWKARKCVLVTGAVLFFIGVIILLAMLLTCIAVECSNLILTDRWDFAVPLRLGLHTPTRRQRPNTD
ncbi:hypothetical protein OSTOST_24278, partial [Ostertagia ostertagi]